MLLAAAVLVPASATAQRSLKSASDAIAAQKALDDAAAFVEAPARAPEPKLDSRQAEVQLKGSNREWLHHGDPLALVGREQEGNDLRSKTPALTHVDGTAAQVDIEELHRRRLAMYDSGAVFHDAAPATRKRVGDSAPVRGTHAAAEEVSEDSGNWPALMSIGVCLLGLAWTITRRKA